MAPKYFTSSELPSAAELEQIHRIRDRCKEEIAALCDKALDVVGDLRICRFLRANGGDEKVASLRFSEFLRWRVEAGIEAERLEVVGRSPEEFTAWFHKRCNPYFALTPYVGRNEDGHIILYIRAGLINAQRFMRHRRITKQEEAQAMLQMLEWTLWHLDELSRQEGRMVYVAKVLDFKGLGMSKNGPIFVHYFKDFVSDWMRLTQKHYCEHNSVFLMINTNAPLFPGVLSFLRLLLSERQVQKIHILGDATKEEGRRELSEYIPEALIPRVYGGTLQRALGSYPPYSEEDIRVWYTSRHLVEKEPPPSRVSSQWMPSEAVPDDLRGQKAAAPVQGQQVEERQLSRGSSPEKKAVVLLPSAKEATKEPPKVEVKRMDAQVTEVMPVSATEVDTVNKPNGIFCTCSRCV